LLPYAELASAYTTTKAEAFCGPLAFVGQDWLDDGITTLPPGLALLADVYDQLGHPNLARQVRQGLKYFRLNQMMRPDLTSISIAGIRALRQAFLGQGNSESTDQDWMDRAWETYSNDENIKALQALEEQKAEQSGTETPDANGLEGELCGKSDEVMEDFASNLEAGEPSEVVIDHQCLQGQSCGGLEEAVGGITSDPEANKSSEVDVDHQRREREVCGKAEEAVRGLEIDLEAVKSFDRCLEGEICGKAGEVVGDGVGDLDTGKPSGADVDHQCLVGKVCGHPKEAVGLQDKTPSEIDLVHH
jgi:hypothetical protein